MATLPAAHAIHHERPRPLDVSDHAQPTGGQLALVVTTVIACGLVAGVLLARLL